MTSFNRSLQLPPSLSSFCLLLTKISLMLTDNGGSLWILFCILFSFFWRICNKENGLGRSFNFLTSTLKRETFRWDVKKVEKRKRWNNLIYWQWYLQGIVGWPVHGALVSGYGLTINLIKISYFFKDNYACLKKWKHKVGIANNYAILLELEYSNMFWV